MRSVLPAALAQHRWMDGWMAGSGAGFLAGWRTSGPEAFTGTLTLLTGHIHLLTLVSGIPGFHFLDAGFSFERNYNVFLPRLRDTTAPPLSGHNYSSGLI